MPNGEHEIVYENRAVAFVDILGWGATVEASVNDAELRKRLHNAIGALGAIAKKDADDDTPLSISRSG